MSDTETLRQRVCAALAAASDEAEMPIPSWVKIAVLDVVEDIATDYYEVGFSNGFADGAGVSLD